MKRAPGLGAHGAFSMVKGWWSELESDAEGDIADLGHSVGSDPNGDVQNDMPAPRVKPVNFTPLPL
jgi:hypothetical protein